MPSDLAYPKMTEQEKDWRAEDDARTLSNAEAIKADTERMERAAKAAKRMLEEEEARTKGLQMVAKGQLKYKNMDKQ